MRRIADRGLRISDLRGAQVPREADDFSVLGTQHPALSMSHASTHNPPSEIRNPQSVELHIEELVLHGFAPGDRHGIADAIERKLAELFTDQGAARSLVQSGEFARVDGGAFNVAPSANAEGIGGQVAQAVYGGLTQ